MVKGAGVDRPTGDARSGLDEADRDGDDRPLGQREATRERLVAAATRRFREHGYHATTAASIAADAAVTERTFFRHFPTKADVLVANWERHREALRTVLADSDEPVLLDLVRTALLAYADRVEAEIDDALGTVVGVYADRTAFVAIVQTVLTVEDDLAATIAARTGRDSNDFQVRLAANASVGAFRAALRVAVAGEDMSIFTAAVDEGMHELRHLYADLERPNRR